VPIWLTATAGTPWTPQTAGVDELALLLLDVLEDTT